MDFVVEKNKNERSYAMKNKTLWSHTKKVVIDGQSGNIITSQIFVPDIEVNSYDAKNS